MAKKRKSLVEVRYAWAIDVNYTDIDDKYYPGFIGRGYFNSSWKDTDDIRQAIFRTRKSTRIELPRIKQTFPNAKIVKVRITIEELK